MTDKTQGPSAFITEAYALHDKQDMVKFYQKWAAEYDEQMLSKGYSSPRDIAALLDEHLFNHDIEVLDIGCGTGLTGQHAFSYGIKTIDGLDLSAEMVEVARSRNLYRHLFVADVNQPLDIQSERYDAVISSGTFTHGHVGPQPLVEIFRILRPGGLLACTIHFDLWESHGFDAVFADLLNHGDIECLALREGAYYDGQDLEGWFCIYRKVT